jgi:transcriptional regulator with XRE-family HTH domain
MAKNSELHVGARLRSMREQKGLSLRALAERCGLSINAISQIERGENSPTVSSLHRLAEGLDVKITDFFQEEIKPSLVLVRRDQRLRSQRNGVLVESLGLGLSNQQIEPFRMVIQPDSGNLRDPISHSGEEFICCLDGEIEYAIGERLVRLKRGDSLLFDATQSHGYWNRTRKQAVILMVFLAFQDPQLARQLHL